MQDFLSLLVVFSVPLAFIGSRAWLRAKELDVLASKSVAPEVDKRLRELEQHNAELRTRIEVLETIATGDDTRRAGISGAAELRELEQRLAERSELPARR